MKESAIFTNEFKYKTVGSSSRLPPRSVLLCYAQRCPPDTRTPQPKTFSDEVREGFTFSLFTLHFSLNPSEKIFGGNK